MPITTSPNNPPLATNNWRPFAGEADLPAPSGGVITLEPEVAYVFFNPGSTQNVAIFTNRIAVPDDSHVKIMGVSQASSLLIYTGTGALFTTSPTFTGVLHLDQFSVSCPNGTLFDIDGLLPVGGELGPRLFLSDFGCFGTDTLGTVKTISMNVSTAAFFDFGQGLVIDQVEEGILNDVRFADGKNEVGSVFITARDMMRFPALNACRFETKSNETAIRIEPTIGTEPFLISSNSYQGTGARYFVGTSGSIASVADAATSGTVTAVSGNVADEAIMTDVAHGLSQHQIITTSGFADSNYNGTFEVLEIVDADNFRIHTLFTATGTGSWDSDLIEVTTTAPHGLSDGEGVQLSGTTTYNDGYTIFNTAASTFEVSATFVATSAGSWTTDSLDEKDPRMVVRSNAGLADSMAIGGTTVNGNVVETTIASTDVYQAVDVTGSTLLSNAERFELVDAVDGVVRYIGNEDLDVVITAAIAAFKSGSTVTYRFTVSINGAIPGAGDFPYASLEIKTTIDNASLIFPVTLTTNDTIQIMVRSESSTNALTVSALTYTT